MAKILRVQGSFVARLIHHAVGALTDLLDLLEVVHGRGHTPRGRGRGRRRGSRHSAKARGSRAGRFGLRPRV